VLWNDVLPILLGWIFKINHDNFALRCFVISFEVKFRSNVVDVAEPSEPFVNQGFNLNLGVKLAIRNIGIAHKAKIITIFTSVKQKIFSVIGGIC
jgi:hypothetical protein